MTKNILTVIVILLTYKFGLIFMSVGYVSASFISFFINSYYTGKFIGYTSVKQLRDLLPYALGGALAVGLSYLLCFFITTELTRLLLGTLLCGLLYFSISRIMNFKELNQIKNILINKFN